jgi:Winged helix DNA-binding domain
MRSLAWTQVWGRRLNWHALLEPRPRTDLVEVVRAVGGIHAQMMSAAELSIGVRMAGVTREDVRAELWQHRTLVKTYGLRGTVHLFPADEAPLWAAALRAHLARGEASRLAQRGMDPTRLATIIAAIGAALDGRRLTREELGEEVTRRTGAWAMDLVSPSFGGQAPRWQNALGGAANVGLLCFGPAQGNKVTFTRADQWLGGWTEVDESKALQEVFRRYLSAYGPATARDFAQWFGIQPRDAADLPRQLADELEEVEVEGWRAWLLAGESEASWPEAQDEIRLLPHFDCYAIGCHPRERLVPLEWRARGLAQGSIGHLPLVIIGGVVAGVWSLRRRGKRAEIQVETAHALNARQRQDLEAAAARISETTQTEATLSFGAVDARPHA